MAISLRLEKITALNAFISLDMGDIGKIATFFVLIFSPELFNKPTFAVLHSTRGAAAIFYIGAKKTSI
ncbi:hypothetical protein [Paenibacillus macerans]|uniref:hypothetical protein n=1 Tax=Paenibacillus macerans TaxID=44252 RepID=UPI00203C6389|nr:hypothetical protein [Paenibacillus macerans]MCM3701121.1 hypothetical protein [Paenibacillus macerans]